MKKRIVSIVLAVAMLCAILTMFASAETDTCPLCGSTIFRQENKPCDYYYVNSCVYYSFRHVHYDQHLHVEYHCATPNCYYYTTSYYPVEDSYIHINRCGKYDPELFEIDA